MNRPPMAHRPDAPLTNRDLALVVVAGIVAVFVVWLLTTAGVLVFG